MPEPAPSFLNTRALMYMLARSAFTAPFVTRPTFVPSNVVSPHCFGRFGRIASSSDSMNRNVESRSEERRVGKEPRYRWRRHASERDGSNSVQPEMLTVRCFSRAYERLM